MASIFGGVLLNGYLLLAPLVFFVVKVVIPFYFFDFYYELGTEYWDNVYKDLGTSGVSKSRGVTPPVYPNGWFKLANSRDVPKGKILNVRYWGQDFVLFRGQDGKIGMLDAYCTHLGAHLGVGGKVKGNCLECPFHGWKVNIVSLFIGFVSFFCFVFLSFFFRFPCFRFRFFGLVPSH